MKTLIMPAGSYPIHSIICNTYMGRIWMSYPNISWLFCEGDIVPAPTFMPGRGNYEDLYSPFYGCRWFEGAWR